MNRILTVAIIVVISGLYCFAYQQGHAKQIFDVVDKIEKDFAEGREEDAVNEFSRQVLTSDEKIWVGYDGSPLSKSSVFDIFTETFFNLVDNLWEKKTPEADDLLKDLLLISLYWVPNNSYSLSYLGGLATRTDNDNEALRWYNHSLKYHPDKFDALYGSATIYYFQENFTEAEKRFQKCLEAPDAPKESYSYEMVSTFLKWIANKKTEQAGD